MVFMAGIGAGACSIQQSVAPQLQIHQNLTGKLTHVFGRRHAPLAYKCWCSVDTLSSPFEQCYALVASNRRINHDPQSD
jgi:hypothetical protein